MNENQIIMLAILGILICMCVVALAGAAGCLVYVREIVEGKFKCDPDNRLIGLLSLALATAVALYKMKKD